MAAKKLETVNLKDATDGKLLLAMLIIEGQHDRARKPERKAELNQKLNDIETEINSRKAEREAAKQIKKEVPANA